MRNENIDFGGSGKYSPYSTVPVAYYPPSGLATV